MIFPCPDLTEATQLVLIINRQKGLFHCCCCFAKNLGQQQRSILLICCSCCSSLKYWMSGFFSLMIFDLVHCISSGDLLLLHCPTFIVPFIQTYFLRTKIEQEKKILLSRKISVALFLSNDDLGFKLTITNLVPYSLTEIISSKVHIWEEIADRKCYGPFYIFSEKRRWDLFSPLRQANY